MNLLWLLCCIYDQPTGVLKLLEHSADLHIPAITRIPEALVPDSHFVLFTNQQLVVRI